MTRLWSPRLGVAPGSYTRRAVPEVGQLIAYVGDRKAWRVVRITDVHQAQWDEQTVKAWEKAGRPDPETWDGRERRIGCEPARDPQPNGKDRRGLLIYPWASQEQWWPLRDPWPECVDCGCLWPCLCDERNDEAARAMRELDRLAEILPGCCWACAKPITARHHSIVFDGENLLLPGGPAPAFHTAGSQKARMGAPCRSAAAEYEAQWVAAAPGRLARLTCPGDLFRHYDSYECSVGDLCPGAEADHRREMHCTTGCSMPLPTGEWVPVRPAVSCGGKGCRGGVS